MQIQCIKCKGKDPANNCGRSYCPILAKSEAMFKVRLGLGKKDFAGSSPNIFIGRIGYPHINVGYLSPSKPVDNAWQYDAPKMWADSNYQINEIIGLRSGLVNSRFKTNIKSTGRMIEIGQEIGMASKPVDIEVNLKHSPVMRLNTNPYTAPMGPNASLDKARITSNPKVDTRVYKVVDDCDLKSVKAIRYLYEKGFDENFLTKIISVGNLGVKYQRKLVPTRWSITAVDDILAKKLIEEIKDYNHTDYTAYFSSYLGNYYLVLMFPDVWSYELYEMYQPKASWNRSEELQYTTDYEPYSGRKTYAENCAGGYYAARLPILEKLKSLKRQGSALVLRIITGEYYCPLGVFVVREAARKSLSAKPIKFASKDLMLNYAKILFMKKFNVDISQILKQSIILKEIKQQSKLKSYF